MATPGENLASGRTSDSQVVRASASSREVAAAKDEVEVDQAAQRARPDQPPAEGEGDSSEDQEDTNLGRSRAERRGGGGGPTRSEDREDRDSGYENYKSELLNNTLGLKDSPVSMFGWLQGSYTANPGMRGDGKSFGINPSPGTNEFVFQQLYFVIEKALDPEKSDEYDVGFRLDNLFGTDWQYYHMTGLFDHAFNVNKFGWEPVQFYADLHLPWLTEGGIDVKAGRFFSLGGYESAMAPSRPLNSAGYLFGYAQPFTHLGVMTTTYLTDRINLYNGVINGWDRWFNENYRWGYAGGISWESKDSRTNVTMTTTIGPNQFPYFFKADYDLAPNGVPQPPFLASRRNLSYNHDNAVFFSNILIHEFTDKLTLVLENDDGFEKNIPSFGPGKSAADGLWYGFGMWWLYAFNEKWTGVFRADMLRDMNGTRTGYNNTFYETTLGAIWKPKTWLWIRPEIRYDWTSGAPVYDNGTRQNQLTFGFDFIFLF